MNNFAKDIYFILGGRLRGRFYLIWLVFYEKAVKGWNPYLSYVIEAGIGFKVKINEKK
jgi:hypothetical protein